MRRSAFGQWWVMVAMVTWALTLSRSAAAQGDDGVTAVVRWARDSGDAKGRPFAVVDKLNARLFIFAPDGSPLGNTPVLLGVTRGDAPSPPGVAAWLKTKGIPIEQRTTPAGRFDAIPGHNDRGEAIVWFDYDGALAIHRLRPSPPAEQRPQRLASPAGDDNRISLGCIVVASAFYDTVVAPHLGRQRSVVYVLPDSRHWSEQFPNAAADWGAAPAHAL